MPANPSDGPPAQNTCATTRAACSDQTCESTPHREGSTLMSIASSQGDGHSASHNKGTHSESGCETIRKTQEEAHNQEQSYTTAPGSLGPSVRTNRSRASLVQEQRRSLSIVSRDDEESTHYGNRSERSHRSSNEWMKMANKWAARAEKNRADLTKLRRRIENELNELCTEVENLIQITTELMDDFINSQCTDECVLSRNQRKEQHEPPPSPRTLATRAVYVDRGSNEGTIDYELRRNAQARFSAPPTH